MKLSLPMPIKALLEGDPPEEEEVLPPAPLVTSPTRIVAHQAKHTPFNERKRSLKEATQLMQHYFSKGIGPRAIVAIKHSSLSDRIDPLQWGLVVFLRAFDSWPLGIRWGDGRFTWTDETDLQVIYPSTSDEAIRDILNNVRNLPIL